jgi:small subunit ribosomal protein S4
LQLREKQKARWTYGVLERQFRKYFEIALDRSGVTGDNLLQVLETRLDNVVYRLSFADSRRQARQLVNHGHFLINGKRMDIPSYIVNVGDVITWKAVNGSVPDFIDTLTDGLPRRPVPSWLQLEVNNLRGTMTSMPHPTEIDTGIEARLIVEFYSK